jgi:hypothetical protein
MPHAPWLQLPTEQTCGVDGYVQLPEAQLPIGATTSSVLSSRHVLGGGDVQAAGVSQSVQPDAIVLQVDTPEPMHLVAPRVHWSHVACRVHWSQPVKSSRLGSLPHAATIMTTDHRAANALLGYFTPSGTQVLPSCSIREDPHRSATLAAAAACRSLPAA